MSTDKLRDNFLFDMAIDEADSETMDWLGKQEYYQKWQGELKKLVEKYPCIDEILEGKEEISLTKDEHKAFVKYLAVKQRMDSAERREYYRFGHVHAWRYGNELGERSSFISKERNSGINPHESQELIGCLDRFVERLDKILSKRLSYNVSYQKLKQEEEEILKRCPVIQRILDGEVDKRTVTLSEYEQKAIEEFFALRLRIESYKELGLYLIGQGDLVKYLNMLLC